MIAWTPELDAVISRLRRAGWGWDAIARRVGFGSAAIRRHARRQGAFMGRMSVGPIPGPIAVADGVQPSQRAIRRRHGKSAHPAAYSVTDEKSPLR